MRQKKELNLLIILKSIALKCHLAPTMKRKAANALSTLNNPLIILSMSIISILIMVQLIVRIKMCLVKTTRQLLSIKKTLQRSRRSAPRPRPKRLQPIWPIYRNNAAFSIRERSRQHIIVFVFWISQMLQKLQSQKRGPARSPPPFLIFQTSLIFLIQITLILILFFRKAQISLIELPNPLRIVKASLQLLYIL